MEPLKGRKRILLMIVVNTERFIWSDTDNFDNVCLSAFINILSVKTVPGYTVIFSSEMKPHNFALHLKKECSKKVYVFGILYE